MIPSSPSDSRSPAPSPAGYPAARSATPPGTVTPRFALPLGNAVGLVVIAVLFVLSIAMIRFFDRM